MDTQPAASRTLALPTNRVIHLGTLVLLLLLAYLSYQGYMNNVLQLLGGSHIDSVDQTYLATASKSATELFEVLSGAKVALALLKSSQGGISFFIDIQVQLGQSLNVVYEMVDYAWLFSLSALAAIKTMEFVLALSQLSVAPLLTVLFSFVGLALGLKEYLPKVAKALAEAWRFILFLVLLVYLVVPLAIYGTAAAGHHFFQSHKTELHQGFSAALATVPKHDLQHGLHSQVESSIDGLKNRQSELHKISSDLSALTIRHITTVICEFLLLPLALFVLLFLLIRRLLQLLLPSRI